MYCVVEIARIPFRVSGLSYRFVVSNTDRQKSSNVISFTSLLIAAVIRLPLPS